MVHPLAILDIIAAFKRYYTPLVPVITKTITPQSVLRIYIKDVIALNIQPQLCTSREKVLISAENKLVGFRRFYEDTVQSAPLPADWPHYIFIRPVIFEKFFAVDALPLSFKEFVRILDLNSIKFQALDVAGAVFDLDVEDGLLEFIATHLKSGNDFAGTVSPGNKVIVADNTRLFGKTLLGKNIRIDKDVLIVGPTLICDGAVISKGAVVKNSIIGSNVSVPGNYIVQNQVLIDSQKPCEPRPQKPASEVIQEQSCIDTFRRWP